MGMFAALQRSFAYRLAKGFPGGLLRWMDAVSGAMDQVQPQVILTLVYPGPTIAAVATTVPGVDASTFTVTHNGAGDVTVSYPADTFRTATARPFAAVTEASATTGWAVACVRGVNNARVFTSAMPAATPLDGGFNLFLYGQ